MSTIETPEELKEGKRRPKHEDLDALYFLRPSVFNLERIAEDYQQEVEKEDKDVLERCMPCLFKGIGTIEPEPAWYSDFRMLVLTGPPSKAGGPFDFRTAKDWLDTRVTSSPLEYQRIPR